MNKVENTSNVKQDQSFLGYIASLNPFTNLFKTTTSETNTKLKQNNSNLCEKKVFVNQNNNSVNQIKNVSINNKVSTNNNVKTEPYYIGVCISEQRLANISKKYVELLKEKEKEENIKKVNTKTNENIGYKTINLVNKSLEEIEEILLNHENSNAIILTAEGYTTEEMNKIYDLMIANHLNKCIIAIDLCTKLDEDLLFKSFIQNGYDPVKSLNYQKVTDKNMATSIRYWINQLKSIEKKN